MMCFVKLRFWESLQKAWSLVWWNGVVCLTEPDCIEQRMGINLQQRRGEPGAMLYLVLFKVKGNKEGERTLQHPYTLSNIVSHYNFLSLFSFLSTQCSVVFVVLFLARWYGPGFVFSPNLFPTVNPHMQLNMQVPPQRQMTDRPTILIHARNKMRNILDWPLGTSGQEPAVSDAWTSKEKQLWEQEMAGGRQALVF